MNYLLFDFEHGHQSLGSKDRVKQILNLPVLPPDSWNDFQKVISQIYTTTEVMDKVMIGDIEVTESKKSIISKEGVIIDGIILDTFSELSKKFQRTLVDKSGKMKLQQWGVLKYKIDGCLEFVTRMPGVVICNCHSKNNTNDDGGNFITPFIDGSSKEDISKWFDFVFYTKVVANKSTGVREYLWVTANSETYYHAKDRTNILDPEIPQDYSLVLDAANKAGFNGSKILIIGAPGSGKTKSLETLNKEKSQ